MRRFFQYENGKSSNQRVLEQKSAYSKAVFLLECGVCLKLSESFNSFMQGVIPLGKAKTHHFLIKAIAVEG